MKIILIGPPSNEGLESSIIKLANKSNTPILIVTEPEPTSPLEELAECLEKLKVIFKKTKEWKSANLDKAIKTISYVKLSHTKRCKSTIKMLVYKIKPVIYRHCDMRLKTFSNLRF